MAIQNLLLPLLSTPTTTDYYTQYAGETSDVRNFLATQGDNLLSSFTQDETITVFNNGLLRINVTAGWYGNHAELNNIEVKNLQTNKGVTINNPNIGYNLYLCLGYDDSVRTAYFFLVGRFYYNKAWNQQDYGAFSNNREDLYLAISGSQPVLYNWQSVPSISGKNGILSLAQIKEEYINDGESVSGASADHFTNLSIENRVDVLIDAALPDPETGGTTVTVKYTIPTLSTGSYEYCKLVAKKKSMPEGPEDGDKIIDINPSLTSIVVRGLDENSLYYFVIFIEDELGNTASSEPQDCTTGEQFVPPEEYRQYLDTINGTGFFFRDWPQVHNDEWNIDYYPHYPLYNQSYKSYGGSSDFNSGSPWIEETTKGIASLYITEQQTGWGYDTTFEAYDWVYWATTPNNRTQIGIINKTNQCILGRSGSSYGWDTDATHNRTDTTGHGYESLSALFYDITRLYRNVNIYVNGILWSSALTQ